MTDKYIEVKCHGCGRIIKILENDPEFCCSVCGAVNKVPPSTGDQYLDCIPPTGFEWTLPSGVKRDPSGKVIKYITAIGSEVSKETFMRIYGCDPEIMLQNMRKLGIDGIEGYKNLSTLGRRGGNHK